MYVILVNNVMLLFCVVTITTVSISLQHNMVSYRSVVEGNLDDWSFMEDLNGVQYVQMDLVMMLEMFPVDNWNMDNPVMSTLIFILINISFYIFCQD